MIFHKLGINNDKKFYLILGGILFFFIIIFQFQLSYQQVRVIRHKQKTYQRTIKVQQHRLNRDTIILHNHIMKTTSFELSKLNTEIMRFMVKKDHTRQEYDFLLQDINRKINLINQLVDKYNAYEQPSFIQGKTQ